MDTHKNDPHKNDPTERIGQQARTVEGVRVIILYMVWPDQQPSLYFKMGHSLLVL